MKDHDDVYKLIAATSVLLRKSVDRTGPGSKHPKLITEITESLKDAHDYSGTIQVMKGFISRHGV